jgi:hypothetical protein
MFSFIFSSLTFTSTIVFNGFYLRKKANITTLEGDIHELQVRILQTFISLEDFLALKTSKILSRRCWTRPRYSACTGMRRNIISAMNNNTLTN